METMTPVFFYHLERQPLDSVLPKLLSMSLERGWRVVVQAGSDERAEALAAQLWSHDDESFLPHGTKADGFPDLQPIWLTAVDENPNNANIRMFVDILNRHERADRVLATDVQTTTGGLSHPLQTVYAPALPAFMR